MKAKHTLLMLGLAVFTFTSCKKTDDTTTGTETADEAIQMQKDAAVSDFIIEDANELFDQASFDNNLNGARPDNSANTNIIPCATVTVTPASGFPKDILIDFGTGCTNPMSGITRSGKIMIHVSDSLRHSGSVSTMTFDNYYVNGYKKEGTITWTNTSSGGHRSWNRTVTAVKITAPNGRYLIHNGTRSIEQVQGNLTHEIQDDAFSITGNSNVVNSAGITHTLTINTALHKRVACHFIDSGVTTSTGPNHSVVLDYGSGDCDHFATIAIDGGTATTIILPY